MIERFISNFYLPFDTSDIISLFPSVDFLSFTEFELFISTITFNILFLCFIGFIVYVFIKSINKVSSWIF